jgi:Spx/MgsR family transcriptional regulator
MPKSTITIYGIPNCDTMKKARTWLDGKGVAYRFHDYRAEGIDRAHVEAWVKALGWEKVLNKASATFKNLPDADKTGLDAKKAVALLLANPTMNKRPMLDLNGRLIAGFKLDIYEEAFAG